jgi:hypothetical protein
LLDCVFPALYEQGFSICGWNKGRLLNFINCLLRHIEGLRAFDRTQSFSGDLCPTALNYALTLLVLFLSLGMFAAEEPGGFSTILAAAQSDRLKVITIAAQPRPFRSHQGRRVQPRVMPLFLQFYLDTF